MERRIEVFIADGSREYAALLRLFLEETPDIVVVGTAKSGDDALRALSQRQPDVLMTDLILPHLSGLALLRNLKAAGKMPRTVVVTRYANENILQAVNILGVKDILMKPCSMDRLTRCIRNVTVTSSPYGNNGCMHNLSLLIRKSLDEVGIMPHLRGFQFLECAVLQAIQDRSVVRGVTKVLYPDLGKQFGTTGNCVERSIREAIKKAWERSAPGPEFPELRVFKGPPSNVRFILAMADHIENRFAWQDVWQA